MRLILLFLVVMFNICTYAMDKVAIIDGGFSIEAQAAFKKYLCSSGHYDLETNSPGIGLPVVDHGDYTLMMLVGSIKRKDYCIITLTSYNPHSLGDAINKAVSQNVKAITMSVWSKAYMKSIEDAVANANKKKIKIFVAAGNDTQDLNLKCNYFPTCLKYDNIVVVGAVDPDGEISSYSNYGSLVVDYYKPGFMVPGHSGTSYSAPYACGQYFSSFGK